MILLVMLLLETARTSFSFSDKLNKVVAGSQTERPASPEQQRPALNLAGSGAVGTGLRRSVEAVSKDFTNTRAVAEVGQLPASPELLLATGARAEQQETPDSPRHIPQYNAVQRPPSNLGIDQSRTHFQQGAHLQQQGTHLPQQGTHLQQQGTHLQQQGAHLPQQGTHLQPGINGQPNQFMNKYTISRIDFLPTTDTDTFEILNACANDWLVRSNAQIINIESLECEYPETTVFHRRKSAWFGETTYWVRFLRVWYRSLGEPTFERRWMSGPNESPTDFKPVPLPGIKKTTDISIVRGEDDEMVPALQKTLPINSHVKLDYVVALTHFVLLFAIMIILLIKN